MAFGRELARAAQQDQQATFARHDREGHAEDPALRRDASAVTPAPAPPVESRAPAAAVGRSSGRGRFMPLPAAAPEPAASLPSGSGRFRTLLPPSAPSAAPSAPLSASPTSTRPSDPAPSSPPLRPTTGSLRLDHLISQVVLHRGLSRDEETRIRREAAVDAEGVQARLDALYRSEIAPARERAVAHFSQALAENPGHVVCLFVQGTRQSVKRWSRAEAGGFALLHGATVETVHASQTPFPSPREIFGPPPSETQVVIEDAAFETPAASRPRI